MGQLLVITIEEKNRRMSSDSQRRWDLVPMFSGAVLQIPEESVSMSRLQKRMLHMEDNWVETADWPFIALSTTSTSVVVPFDEPGQEGVMPELIIIIPQDFFTEKINRQRGNETLDWGLHKKFTEDKKTRRKDNV